MAAPIPHALAASLSAAPDRFVVGMGETFDLVLSLTDGDSREPPDVSALARDFDIVDRGRTSHGEMVDGKPAHIDQWVMTLSPKRTGTLTVPPLTVGKLTSTPVQVQVVPSATPTPPDDSGLFVRLEVAATPAFVQSDIPVTIRIYDRLGLRAGSMSEPAAEGASFTADGGRRTYLKTLGKNKYRVIEQSFLMRPQRSGVIEIPPVTLNAVLPGFKGSSAASDLPSLLGRGVIGDLAQRTVVVRSQPASVTVQPRPEGVTGWFLPARAVALSQSWSKPPAELKVGDTLTRTLLLTAQGAGPNQLPPLAAAPVDGLRQYEETSHADATLIAGQGGAALTQSFSIVPTRPGTFTLPAITVPWWNLTTNRQETATLPEVTLTVAPGAQSAPPPTAAPGPADAASPAPPPGLAAPEPPAAENGQSLARLLVRLLASLFALAMAHRLAASVGVGVGLVVALAVAGGLFLSQRRRRWPLPVVANATMGPTRGGRRRGPLSPQPADSERLMAALTAACRQGEAAAAQAALSALVRLGALALDADDLQQAAEALARHLYAGAAGRWDGRPLLKALARARQRQGQRARRGWGARLAPLYPAAR